ncbi:hypothetical protein KQX54_013951 [Cotesia glomerata]|uniref:Uncharacterized protein n=1 Tax=Cotesia glomerata TaxID=32391 RepID=A0AAV7I4R7_COTGL|nr:hypothetical protein KQX54_013951 [Cotesia glomerata]
MDKILDEIKALRADKEVNQKELTAKIMRNSTLFIDACDKISTSLDKFREEYQLSKVNFEARISALETNSVKNSQKLKYLEKERKRNNIAIIGLELPTFKQAAYLQNFLKVKFNVECSSDSIKFLAKRIIVDLKCSEVKATVMKNKKCEPSRDAWQM